ncbi:MAG: gamma-glutamylcyclotransferase [Bryobacteraceae bacterium]|nr:gamma-glutamylcyclotransferase [Bryobacteraceae bacterium]
MPYFAYGSNLSRSQMEKRLGRVPPARAARLEGWRLAFNKRGRPVYANIVRHAGGAVWGVLYECTEAELAVMDRYEGVAGGHYRRIVVEVETEDGGRLAAITYEACPQSVTEEHPPPPEYAARILQGAAEHGLPEAWLKEVLRLCEASR